MKNQIQKRSFLGILLFVLMSSPHAFSPPSVDQQCSLATIHRWGGIVPIEICDTSRLEIKTVVSHDTIRLFGHINMGCCDSLRLCSRIVNDTVFIKADLMGNVIRTICCYGFDIAVAKCTLPNYRVFFFTARDTLIGGTILDTILNMSTSSEVCGFNSNGIIFLSCTPNPFRTSISFEVFGENFGRGQTLNIYDIAGKRIAVLSGTDRFVWERGVYPSGAYVAVLRDRRGKAIVSKRFLSF